MPEVLAFGRWKQDGEFEAILNLGYTVSSRTTLAGYIASPCVKKMVFFSSMIVFLFFMSFLVVTLF
jgi:hypothetical protein